MATLYRTMAIPMSWRDHQEADRWYSVLTRDRGKVEFRARGAHKPLAKLSPHLEMVAEVDLLLINGRLYETVAGVDRARAFPNIYKDLSLLLLAKNALHLVDIGTKTYQYDPMLYDEVLTWLDFLNTSPSLSSERSGYLLGSFALKLMRIIGYHPELNSCLSCKEPVQEDEYKWHSLKGGVVCKKCTSKDNEQWFSARLISNDALKLLRFASQNPYQDQLKTHLPGNILMEFHDAIESLIICHFPTIPASSLRAACNLN